jgi:putative transposase
VANYIKIIPVQRTSKWDLKDIIDAILYECKNDYVWRDLPGDFPAWQTVYWYYRQWVKKDILKNISSCLTVDYRVKMGKSAQPSVAIIDSQSVKNSATCTEEVGIEGGKYIKGRKRFFIVDTLGNLLYSFVCAANKYDGTIAIKRWEHLSVANILLDQVEKVYADRTFGGTFSREMFEKMGVKVEIPKIPITQKGKVEIHEKRWIEERTISWTNNNRRCSKNYKRKTQNANAFLIIAHIRTVAKKI